MKMEKPRAYSYIRISSKGQLQGSGISRQIDQARAYATEHNLDLDETLQDIGKSGFHGEHVKSGALGSFLNLIRNGQIPESSYLLVESFDRLSRENVLTASSQFTDILKAGIYVVTLSDGAVYHRDKDYTQLIISLTYMSRANNESAEKSKRIKAAIKKRKTETAAGKPRYNHHLVGWIDQNPVPGSKEYKFKLNDKARSVQKIFELADQGIGAHTIARLLNDENYPVLRDSTNRTMRWKDASVWGVIKNEIVIGTHQVFDTVEGKKVPIGSPIENYYPAAVDAELFWRVQRKRLAKSTKETGAKGRRFSNLFARSTACTHCRQPLRFSRGGTSNKPLFYLSCSDKITNSKSTCPRQFYRYEVLESAVLACLPDFHHAALDLHSANRLSKTSIEREIDSRKAAIEKHETERKNTLSMAPMLESIEDRQAIADQANQLRGKIEENRSIISRLENESRELSSDGKHFSDLIENIFIERKNWETCSDDNKVFQSRARVSEMLSQYISLVQIDFSELEATVWIAGFTKAYRFDRKGKLIGSVNLVDAFRNLGRRPFAIKNSDGTVKMVKPNRDITPTFNRERFVSILREMGLSAQKIDLAIEANKKLVEAAERQDHRFYTSFTARRLQPVRSR
ncbi:hypothetical protein DEM27_03055 [Metarhizobium album]|uniref:Resolvase/invertase-type recombinase catalytic domain-containing protein n=1 Tax=Metarhizobium album TaxID=2182425 RepID=A0A2U2DXX5_9HYPH|nr:recombinase family protein [Rhizobium album]PWE58173.1 hypothetical protein DEM27_03055 [Rhizobium album]